MSIITPCQKRTPVDGSCTSTASSLIQTVRPSLEIMRYSLRKGASSSTDSRSSETTRSRSSGCVAFIHSVGSARHSSGA